MQELALAKAERERLDEREQAIRKVERELAGLRVKLQEEQRRRTGSAPSEPQPGPTSRTRRPILRRRLRFRNRPPSPDLEPAASSKRRRSSMLADPQLRKRS